MNHDDGQSLPDSVPGSVRPLPMTAVDNLWYLAREARQQAQQVYHDFQRRHDGFVAYTPTRTVSRDRFRTVARRIESRGLPFGAHTLAYRPDGRVLLVRQPSVGQWVLPGGEVDAAETVREGARRELQEESGIDVEYDGLGILGRVTFRCGDHETWGVLPMFEGEAKSVEPSVDDPDGEISDARWFESIPEDARDCSVLREWREHRFGR